MASNNILCAGYQVTSHATNVMRTDTPMVILFKMGTHDRGYLTPEEARRLANLLVEAAKAAEVQP